jgi:hypothetical protein
MPGIASNLWSASTPMWAAPSGRPALLNARQSLSASPASQITSRGSGRSRRNERPDSGNDALGEAPLRKHVVVHADSMRRGTPSPRYLTNSLTYWYSGPVAEFRMTLGGGTSGADWGLPGRTYGSPR